MLFCIVALYQDDKILLESTTYESVRSYRNGEVLADIIVIEDFDKLKETLNDIVKNAITTTLLLPENSKLRWQIAELMDAVMA